MEIDFSKYGHFISDCEGNLKDLNAIISDLEDMYDNFSTHAMSDYCLFLEGEKQMLSLLIKYLKSI